MSTVLKLPWYNGKPNNIYLIYDFKQVKDVILMVMYVDKLRAWKKIFLNYRDDKWKTNILTCYMNAETYKQVCNKLQLISPTVITANEKALNLERTIQQEATFLLNMYY
jgi:hypothetical protein